jgi:hypothetical protein
MSESQTRVIDGLEVRTTKLMALAQGELALTLLTTVGPILVPIAMSGGKTVEDLDTSVIAMALAQMPANVDVKGLFRRIFVGTDVVTSDKVIPLNSDAMINGVFPSLKTMLAAARFVVEVNFGDFFDASPTPASGAKV